MATEVYCKGECIDSSGRLCIITRGLCARNGAVKRKGGVWGEDFVLMEKLRKQGSAMSLTFSESRTTARGGH